MAACAARMISVRASRPFIRSANRNSPADDLHRAGYLPPSRMPTCCAAPDDLPVRRDTLPATILRSPPAHAEILSVDVASALALPDVDCVVIGEDARRWTRPFVVALETPMQHWCRVVAAKYSPAVSNARVARRPVVRSYKRPAPSPSTQMGALRGYHPTNPMVAIERVCKGRL